MKKFLLIVLSLAGLAGCKTSKVTKQPPVDENALLWKISGKNLSKPSYLYGTIHMICATDFIISDSLKSAFNRADKIYLELDMDDPTMDAKMLRLSVNKGRKLSDIFSKEDYAKLNTFFRDSVGYYPAGYATELAERLIDLLEDERLRNRYRQIALERARSFTWQRTARATADFLVSVAGSV